MTTRNNQGTPQSHAFRVEADVRPRVEVARTSKGDYSWRISTFAADDTPQALAAARELALSEEAEIRARLQDGEVR